MREPCVTLFVFALGLLHNSYCIKKSTRFRRLSLTPSRFALKYTSFRGVSLLECTELGTDEGVLGINYQASSKVCELIKKTDGCADYDSGDITGWQAFRRCGNGTIGKLSFLF